MITFNLNDRARDMRAFAYKLLLQALLFCRGSWMPPGICPVLFGYILLSSSNCFSLHIQASLPFNWAFQLCFRGLELQFCLTVVYVKLIYLAAVALCQGRGRLNGEAVRKLIAWWTAVAGESSLFASSNDICYQGFFLFAPFPLFEMEEYQLYTRDGLGWLVPKPVSLPCWALHLFKRLKYSLLWVFPCFLISDWEALNLPSSKFSTLVCSPCADEVTNL